MSAISIGSQIQFCAVLFPMLRKQKPKKNTRLKLSRLYNKLWFTSFSANIALNCWIRSSRGITALCCAALTSASIAVSLVGSSTFTSSATSKVYNNFSENFVVRKERTKKKLVAKKAKRKRNSRSSLDFDFFGGGSSVPLSDFFFLSGLTSFTSSFLSAIQKNKVRLVVSKTI